jgi:hypothetical protein
MAAHHVCILQSALYVQPFHLFPLKSFVLQGLRNFACFCMFLHASPSHHSPSVLESAIHESDLSLGADVLTLRCYGPLGHSLAEALPVGFGILRMCWQRACSGLEWQALLPRPGGLRQYLCTAFPLRGIARHLGYIALLAQEIIILKPAQPTPAFGFPFRSTSRASGVPFVQ